MNTQTISRQRAKEAAEDIFFGQITIIWARWFLVAAGTMIALLSPNITPLQFTVATLVIIALMIINFFMHGRYMIGKPSNQLLLMLASLLDMGVVTLLVVLWGSPAGLDSYFFVLYYPLLFAFTLVFPPTHSLLFTVLTLSTYCIACMVATDPALTYSLPGFELLAMRVITLGSMGGLGAYYYRRQREILRQARASRVPLFK